MAYVPVDFDLHDFQLNLNTAQSAKFHKRLKELGFDSVQNGETLIYARGKSRITAFVHSGSALNFLPDFFDDTPGGTVYAIMEKMCVAFGGTMVGKYSIPALGKEWDIRISGGMNLSGRADVGQRDHVMEDDAGHLAPSNGAVSSSGANAQQKGTQAPSTAQSAGGQSGGQVQAGQSGESSRDKLYRLYVEEAYKQHTEANGDDPSKFLELVKNFNTQFPKEEETEEQKKRAQIIQALKDYITMPNANEKTLNHEIQLLINNGEEVGYNVADAYSLDEEEVEAVIDELNGGVPFGQQLGAKAVPQGGQNAQQQLTQQLNQALQSMVGQPNNAQTQAQMAQAVQQTLSNPKPTMPLGWTLDIVNTQEVVRQLGAQVYYKALSPNSIGRYTFDAISTMQIMMAVLQKYNGTNDEEVYEILCDEGLQDIHHTLQTAKSNAAQAKHDVGL